MVLGTSYSGVAALLITVRSVQVRQRFESFDRIRSASARVSGRVIIFLIVGALPGS